MKISAVMLLLFYFVIFIKYVGIFNKSTFFPLCLFVYFFLQVVDHYENPRNVGILDKHSRNVGTGLVGAPACGDVMKLQVCCSLSTDYFSREHRPFSSSSVLILTDSGG